MISLDIRKNGEVWYAVAGVLSVRTMAEALAVLDDYVDALFQGL